VSLIDEAACADRTDIDFFPEGRLNTPTRARRTAPALWLCWTKCSKRVPCAQDAIKNGVLHGVVAGVDLGDVSASGGSFRNEAYLKQVERLYKVAGVPFSQSAVSA
jgi:hypothetical protein